ncbi:MAG: hypothetical protein D6784_06690 [Chloroflexi bacterium]|nr:MAG: hypothetical protein D6784_06690 [Chloroflexota bacterium]
MNLLNNILTIYTWTLVGFSIYFLYLIARFYEKKSGRRSFSWVFWGPIGLFVLAAVRYLFLSPLIVGDIWGDGMRAVAGLMLVGFGLYLLNLMVGGKR